MDAYIAKYPEKHKVSIRTSQLRKKLNISPEFSMHHWSYSIEHANDVIILSKKDHYFLHIHLIYDQPSKLYRTLEGDLLDTNMKHYAYFKQCKANSKE